jgi:hypothetical protein
LYDHYLTKSSLLMGSKNVFFTIATLLLVFVILYVKEVTTITQPKLGFESFTGKAFISFGRVPEPHKFAAAPVSDEKFYAAPLLPCNVVSQLVSKAQKIFND